MKQGGGKEYRADGSTYTGTWESNVIVGFGKASFVCNDLKKRDGLPKEVNYCH
jgi:hypothetical protein